MPGTTADVVTIADAKALATKARQVGVLVIGFAGGRYAVTTYGATRRHCDALRRVNERIFALIEAGVIEIPPELGG